jgi:hypothetical protein
VLVDISRQLEHHEKFAQAARNERYTGETYFRLLPSGASEITAEDQRELAVIFGEGGEPTAERLS